MTVEQFEHRFGVAQFEQGVALAHDGFPLVGGAGVAPGERAERLVRFPVLLQPKMGFGPVEECVVPDEKTRGVRSG